VFFGVWTLITLLSTTSEAVNRAYADLPADWARMLIASAAYWYGASLCMPVFLWLARRRPLGHGRWWRTLPLYAAVALGLTFLHSVFFLLVRNRVFPAQALTLGATLRKSFFYELVLLSAMVGAAHALEYGRSLREREVKASQLEARLSKAQLEVLRSELQPHFFFNALHSISTLMHRNVEAADEMLTQLADLLRLSLERRSVQEVPLREELALLEHYLKIMRIRFGDRLSISVDADPRLLDVRVPLFILQPLVENALQHGIAKRAGAGGVAIEARPVDASVEIVVRDDGPGLSSPAVREGIGLSNCRLRLEQLYGPAGTLAISNQPGRGTQVTIRLPHRASAPEPAA
jgi:signal transduction histidine kinase